ncbi:MAG TPA: hypothetical protein VD997_03785 [Phycisphaerales bacterium]|nr:hypothetical protein [Phycisphaerales bacterium]
MLKPVGVRLLEPNLLIVDTLYVSRRWDTVSSQARVARYIYNGELWGAMAGKGLTLEMCDGARVEVLPIDISSPSKYSRDGFLPKTLETSTPARIYTVFPLVYRTARPLEVGQCVTVRPWRVGEHTVEPDTDPVTFTIAPYQSAEAHR